MSLFLLFNELFKLLISWQEKFNNYKNVHVQIEQ